MVCLSFLMMLMIYRMYLVIYKYATDAIGIILIYTSADS